MNNSHIILNASKKMLLDKLELNLSDSQINPILQKAISLNYKNNQVGTDLKIYNKELLKYILDYFSSYTQTNDTIENAIHNLDLQRNQPVINIPINDLGSNDLGSNDLGSNDLGSNDLGSKDVVSNDLGKKISIKNEEPYNINLNLPKNDIIFNKSYAVHSINRNINIYNKSTFFSFILPKYIKITPNIIIFDDTGNINFSYLSLIINDQNGKVYSYDFWKKNNNIFETISDLEPIYTDNNNEFTLALYNDYKDYIDIGIDNITILNIILNKNNYIITFDIDIINFDKFIVNELLFSKNIDNSFSCNSSFNINTIINSKCIPVLNNQFHLLFTIQI